MADKLLQVIINEDTDIKLTQLAKEDKRNRSQMIRRIIDLEYERVFKSKSSTYQQPTLTQAD